MSRLKKFQRNLIASYSQLGAMTVCSLVSVPLILKWLPLEEFGLWALLVQVMWYVACLDLGMAGATVRLLIDCKDNPADGQYGSLIRTFWLVCAAQAVLLVMAVLVLAPVLADLLNIPNQYETTFITLLRWQGMVLGFNFLFRPLNLILTAHQRSDITVYNEIFLMFISLGFMIFLLSKGVGIFSYFYAGLVGSLVTPLWLWWNCRRLRLLPCAGQWGKITLVKFKDVFGYGLEVFWVGLGWQLITGSQTIVVSRFLGLEAAAIWSVGLKVFNLLMQMVLRVFYSSMPALAEMLVRQESERLKKRFRELMVLAASLAVLLAFGLSLCNSLFINVWLDGKIAWLSRYDVLLAIWLVVVAMQNTHLNLILMRKEIGRMGYVLSAEGVCFITVSGLWAKHWGIEGVVGTMIACTLCFSWQYCLRRGQYFFGYASFWEIAFHWLRPCFQLMLWLGLIAAACWLMMLSVTNLWLRLAINAAVAGLAGGILFVKIGCPVSIAREFFNFLPLTMKKMLSWLEPKTV